jgi:Domain of unknown function (DUF4177)
MKKFEYFVLNIGPNGFWKTKLEVSELAEKLNELGLQGWEVVSNTTSNPYENQPKNFLIILKREII